MTDNEDACESEWITQLDEWKAGLGKLSANSREGSPAVVVGGHRRWHGERPPRPGGDDPVPPGRPPREPVKTPPRPGREGPDPKPIDDPRPPKPRRHV